MKTIALLALLLSSTSVLADSSFVAPLSRAASTTSPANPTGTSSTSAVMMGLGGSITPTATGRVFATLSGNWVNTVIADGCNYTMRFGTGAAPANGVAATGTIMSSNPGVTATVGNTAQPIAFSGYVGTLTVGTAYWVDLAFNAVTGGTCTFGNTQLIMLEQ